MRGQRLKDYELSWGLLASISSFHLQVDEYCQQDSQQHQHVVDDHARKFALIVHSLALPHHYMYKIIYWPSFIVILHFKRWTTLSLTATKPTPSKTTPKAAFRKPSTPKRDFTSSTNKKCRLSGRKHNRKRLQRKITSKMCIKSSCWLRSVKRRRNSKLSRNHSRKRSMSRARPNEAPRLKLKRTSFLKWKKIYSNKPPNSKPIIDTKMLSNGLKKNVGTSIIKRFKPITCETPIVKSRKRKEAKLRNTRSLCSKKINKRNRDRSNRLKEVSTSTSMDSTSTECTKRCWPPLYPTPISLSRSRTNKRITVTL